MIELYYMGGTLFMGILSLIFLSILVVAGILLIKSLTPDNDTKIRFDSIKSIGLFAVVVGVLGQFIGLYSAFESIEKVGEVSQTILFAGLKISSISTIYGMIIFIISYLLWFGLAAFNDKVSIS